MTNAEALAQAYPLHYQRIIELIHAFNPTRVKGMNCTSDEFLMRRAKEPAGFIIADGFDWADTEEGFDYWRVLACTKLL
jgi:hypothetical protein